MREDFIWLKGETLSSPTNEKGGREEEEVGNMEKLTHVRPS